MRYKIIFIVTVVLLMAIPATAVQMRTAATSKGASLVSGMLSFSSQGGDLYSWEDDRLTTIAIVPSYFYFVAPGMGIGGDISYNRMSQGDHSLTNLGIGPKIGYFIDSGSPSIPYIAGGINYLSIGDEDDSESGWRFKFGGGVLIRQGHLAVAIEADYFMDRFTFEEADKATTGNAIIVAVGLAGFLYK
jgi:hypothetical protein